MADIVFLAFTVITIASAIVALESEEIVYGAVALGATFFGVAVFFFLLDAPFVAVFQISIYVGAVAVLILFTVMLVRQERWIREVSFPGAKLIGAFTAAAISFSLILAFVAYSASKAFPTSNQVSFLDIGKLISGSLAPALEALTLVLAASIVGAITLAKVESDKAK
jgi:NADH:ubiquinone oxidoreductase subunit 6 (subunit J)